MKKKKIKKKKKVLKIKFNKKVIKIENYEK